MEPLSRSLRGRPFEHEELYEILFPDVIGSGGAPKRLTKQRPRKPNENLNPSGPGSGHGPGHADQDAPNTTIMNLLADPSYANSHSHGHMPPPPPVHSASAPLPSPIPAPVLAPIPTPPTLPSSQPPPPPPPPPPHSRPNPTAHQPRNNPNTSALTPPEENPAQNRRRPHMPDSSGSSGSTNAEKRRRTASSSVDHATQASGIARAVASGVDRLPTAEEVAEVRFSKPRLSWAEQAVEIFFRDFTQEDMDFQLKVAEKALTDENKAMVFCKMPSHLRKHWIKRLREAHNRSI
ncbi:hypothetical protein QBC45DRAFT_111926 [Copromyces sp. CBS 386.78]|nr:hypothetical protein QBC45DRAFT_111926 [Copromyces sp. CBS 386.78]